MIRVFLFLLFMIVSSCTTAPKYTDVEMKRLLEDATEIDKIANVTARKYVDTYFHLAEAYFERGLEEPALEAVKKGLRIESAKLEYQLLASKIELELGKFEQANIRARNVARYSSNAALRKQATEIISSLDRKSFVPSRIDIPQHFDKYIYVVSVGNVDTIYLSVIQNKIEEQYQLTVKVLESINSPTTVNLRNKHQEYFDQTVQKIIDQFGQGQYENLVKELTRSGFISKDDDTNQKVVYYLYLQEENGIELWKKNMDSIVDQYDANEILQQVWSTYKDKVAEPNCLGILAVTDSDIFAEDYNFLFGLNGSETSVMSISRFVNSEVVNTTKIKRIDMQALSSAGFLVGIPRCTVSYCARAYPHSLAEHDAKEDLLCEECKSNLVKVYSEL